MKTGTINGNKREVTFVDFMVSAKREKDVQSLGAERDVWSFYSMEQRHKVAHSLATAHKDRTDPTSYAVIYNRLMNCVATPQDYGMTAQAMRNMLGKPGLML